MDKQSKKNYDSPKVTKVRLDDKTAVLATGCKTTGTFGPLALDCALPGGCEAEGS
jgi:hypothetical protein